MKTDAKFVCAMRALHRCLIFFVIVAFIATCCLTLFVTAMTVTMKIELTSKDVQVAAKLTMLNVVILSLILTVCDVIRRRITVDRPVKCIIAAAERIMQGDFSARIDNKHIIGSPDSFDEIAEYFNKMAEELSHTETLRTDFVANVSHEIKTPLAVIQNYATLLQDVELTEQKRTEYAKIINLTSRRLASLVTNILRLNKLENQKIAPKFERYNLSEQLCECLLGFEEAWEAKELEISTDIEDGVTVCCDADMMSLVWNNLFSNAIKFTEKGGGVSLSLKTDGEWAIVCVSDTGCGISAEVGKRMFDKFYQGDTSHSAQGNGLGLALVRRVVDITGCDVSVESKVGVGSSFTVKIRRVV